MRLPATTDAGKPGTTIGTTAAKGELSFVMTTEIIRDAIPRARLAGLAAVQFGDMVKAVVDVDRNVMAIGGELHSDEEAALLDDGSAQASLWGINLYPEESGDAWIEFDSMINVRPAQGNRSRTIEDSALRERIRSIVTRLVEA